MVNPFGFLAGGSKGRRSRKDTESGEKADVEDEEAEEKRKERKKKAEAERKQEALSEKQKLRPKGGDFAFNTKLEDSDEEDQEKVYEAYREHMLQDIEEDTVPSKPLAKAMFFLQKYTMIAAAVKEAEAKNAKFQKTANTVEDDSDIEDDTEDEDEWEKRAEKEAQKATPKGTPKGSNTVDGINPKRLAKWSAKFPASKRDDIAELIELKRKAEYARRRAEGERVQKLY